MRILGTETTCDETSAAVVEDGRKVLSNVVSSSALLQRKYRGVVPEIAAREQVKVIIPVISVALDRSDCSIDDIDALAVAYGPGLSGSLLIGVEAAKTLALVWKKPLVPVNHLIGHVYANWIGKKVPQFPLVALIVSGGHTDLILMTDHGKFRWLGGTRDDAAGEAFDKVARVLGLGYPGGPEIEKVASQSQSAKLESSKRLPRPMISEDNFDFSFAGLKTAVVNLVNRHLRGEESSHLGGGDISAIAYEFQKAICEVLVIKTLRAAKKFNAKSIVVGGGVAANDYLRSQLTDHGWKLAIPVFFPPKDLAVDNGAMIAAAAFWFEKTISPLKLQADPALHFA